jgi:hypothetical protein
VNPVTGKRKRSRVSAQQLAFLERVFAKERSPTAIKRKELAEQLGMNERQTQVWFQNRRAKQKLLEQRVRVGRPPVAQGDHSGSSSGGSHNTQEGDADALGRIHEDERTCTRFFGFPALHFHFVVPRVCFIRGFAVAVSVSFRVIHSPPPHMTRYLI